MQRNNGESIVRRGNTAVLSDEDLDLQAQTAYCELLVEQSVLSLSEGSGTPEWFQWATNELSKLESLPKDWDGDGSIPPPSRVLQVCEAVLSEFGKINSGLSAPYIVPAVDGRVLFEWRIGARTLNVEVTTNMNVAFLFRDRELNVSSKGLLLPHYFPTPFVKALQLF